jgi:hypothetical protein
MPSECYTVFRVPAVRATQLDSCGIAQTGACEQVVSSGLISVAQAPEYEARQDYFTLNADAQPCITDTAPPILKWINVTIVFCQVDPQLLSMLSGEPLVLDDATTPNVVGWDTAVGSVNSVNFALETWTRIGGSNACNGANVNYGYFLLPWVTEGTIGDVTLQNGAANFTVTGRTNANSPWGTGPYNVLINQTGTNANFPGKMLTAIGANTHRRIQLVNLAPPTAQCGCQALPGLSMTAAAVVKAATLTFHVAPAPTFPLYVDWGDGTVVQITTPALTATHTYATAATFTIKSGPMGFSAAPSVTTVTTT